MSIEWITVLLLASLMVLLVLGLPLAWAIGATAIGFTLLLFGPFVMVMMVSRVFDMMLNYTLMAVPLFVLMAAILQRAGVAEQMFRAVHIWAGGMRGGLAVGTIITNAIMAAMVGVIGAEIVTFGLIALPAMLARKYDDKLALGSIAAGGGLATLIPPSVVFIVYAMTAGCSVGELFIAGIVPGLLLGAMFIAYILYRAWRYPESAPAAPAEERDMPLSRKLALLGGLIIPSLIAVGVLGSIYTGVATPSEAAGIGVLGALLAAAANRKLSWASLRDSLYETTKISCMLAWLFFGAQTIIGIYSLAGGTEFVKHAITSMNLGPWGTIVFMQLILIFLGMFLDWIGILLLTMPLFVPVILDMGFSNIWFGVVFCMNMHVAYLSPPFGPSCFYLKSVAPDHITMGKIYASVMPYLWITVGALALTVAFPQLSLWLPAQMLGR